MAELLNLSGAEAGNYGSAWVGQAITPDADWEIEQIYHGGAHCSPAQDNITCYIYANTGNAPSGSALATSDAVTCATNPGTDATWTFVSPYVALSGTKIWVVFKSPGNGAYLWREDGSDPYTGGTLGYTANADILVGWSADNLFSSDWKVIGELYVASSPIPSGRRGFTTRSTLFHSRG